MSKRDKLVERIKGKPKDLRWEEVVTLCEALGFETISGNGSRFKFYHKKLDFSLFFHRPHPSNIVKNYVVKQLLNSLTERGLI